MSLFGSDKKDDSYNPFSLSDVFNPSKDAQPG